MDPYSVMLAVAMAATLVALIAVLPGCLGRTAKTERHRRSAVWASSIGLGLVLAATAFHILSGHRPGAPEALGFVGFVAEHRALVGTGAIALALMWRAWTI